MWSTASSMVGLPQLGHRKNGEDSASGLARLRPVLYAHIMRIVLSEMPKCGLPTTRKLRNVR